MAVQWTVHPPLSLSRARFALLDPKVIRIRVRQLTPDPIYLIHYCRYRAVAGNTPYFCVAYPTSSPTMLPGRMIAK